MKIVNPANKSRRPIEFCTPAGVEHVQVENKKWVSGRFKAQLADFYGPKQGRLIQDFVNWRTDLRAVLSFTQKYGPLHDPAVPGKGFRFRIEVLEAAQAHFRSLWKDLHKYPDWEVPGDEGASLSYRGGQLVYRTSSLYMYLYLDLVTCGPERLRRCRIQSCPTPYFFADHLQQQYCSSDCASTAQSQAKRDWWKTHGSEWRARRKKKAKNS